MGYALGDVWDAKEYVAGLEVSPTRRCSLLEGLRINSKSSDNLELVPKELWRASTECYTNKTESDASLLFYPLALYVSRTVKSL